MFRLSELTSQEQKRRRDFSRDFRQALGIVVGWPSRALCGDELGVLIGDSLVLFLEIAINQVHTNGRLRVIGEQLLLFVGPFGNRRLVRLADFFLQFVGQPFHVLFAKPRRQLFDLFGSFLFESFNLGIELRDERVLLGGPQRNEPRVWASPVFPVECRLEDRSHPVVIDVRDRVVTVRMTLSTSDGQPQQRRADDLDCLGEALIASGVLIHRRIAGAVRPHAEEAGGDQHLSLWRGQAAILNRCLPLQRRLAF